MNQHRRIVVVLSLAFVVSAAAVVGAELYRTVAGRDNAPGASLPRAGTVVSRSNAIDIQFTPGVSRDAVAAMAREYDARIDFLDPPFTTTIVREAVFEFSPTSSLNIQTIIEQVAKQPIVETATVATYEVEYDQPL
jgi:hypothetical protein